MNKLQILEKDFNKEFPSKGMQYQYPNYDFSEIQLDGWYNASELRKIADKLDEYNSKIDE